MQPCVLSPADPRLSPMLTLRLDHSLVVGLEQAVGVQFRGTISVEAADKFSDWANNVCDNPHGQRADLARAIAAIIRAGNGAKVAVVQVSEPYTTFWENVKA